MAESESIVAAAKVQSAVRSRAEGEPLLEVAGTKTGGSARVAPRGRAKVDDTTRTVAEAKTLESSGLKAAEAKTADEARAAARKTEEDEEARADAEIDALAEQEARVATLARERSERKAKAKADSERRTAEQARLAAASKAKTRKDARPVPSDEASHWAHPSEEVAELAKVAADSIKRDHDPVNTQHAVNTAKTPQVTKGTVTSPLLQKPRLSRASTKRIWHYTSEGDRLGPISLDELRKRAADSLLDPRLDMIWKKGMDEWTPAGRIDGLFDPLNEPPKTRQLLATPTVPLQPTQRFSRTKSRIKLTWPGARRRSLLLATLVFPIAWKIVLVAMSPILTKQFGIILMEKILPLAALAPLAVVIHFASQRLMNLGMSRWWLLAACVPALNLWLGYRCFACPPGFACHKKLDGPGIAMTALYWIAMATVTWMLVFKPAKLADLVGSPLLQKQLRSAILRN